MTIRRTHKVAERVEAQVYTFATSAGVGLNLTGYTASTKWKSSDGVLRTGSATVVTPASGIVTWSWPNAIFDQAWVVGANVVVTNGTFTFTSDDFVLRVVKAAGG